MRQDQFDRLNGLEERLIDVFFEEAEPDKWPGSNTPTDQQDKMIRGDRYWHKKNAVATLSLINRLNALQDLVRRNTSDRNPGTQVNDAEDDLDKDITDAEKEATRLIGRIKDPEERRRFLERAVGKT